MSKKFSPESNQFKNVEDLPQGEQGKFRNIEGGGFVKKEVVGFSEEMAEEADRYNKERRSFLDKVFGENKVNPVDLVHGIALEQNYAFSEFPQLRDKYNKSNPEYRDWLLQFAVREEEVKKETGRVYLTHAQTVHSHLKKGREDIKKAQIAIAEIEASFPEDLKEKMEKVIFELVEENDYGKYTGKTKGLKGAIEYASGAGSDVNYNISYALAISQYKDTDTEVHVTGDTTGWNEARPSVNIKHKGKEYSWVEVF